MMRGMDSLPHRAAGAALLLVVTLGGCATRQSVESLQRQISQLEQQNFQLRKDLAEARVRADMKAERGEPADHREEPLAELPQPGRGPEAPVVPSRIYSEPITDASRYTSGPLSAQPVPRRSEARSAVSGPTAGSPSALMGRAREELDRRNAEGALELFQQIVTSSPDDALADDAQFGVGECYFQQERYEEAIGAYRKVMATFPFGDQAPFALLKIGFSQLALGRRGTALESFQQVSETYPGTEAATVARQQIAHLKATGR
jgi:tol-pal system protein YbgF